MTLLFIGMTLEFTCSIKKFSFTCITPIISDGASRLQVRSDHTHTTERCCIPWLAWSLASLIVPNMHTVLNPSAQPTHFNPHVECSWPLPVAWNVPQWGSGQMLQFKLMFHTYACKDNSKNQNVWVRKYHETLSYLIKLAWQVISLMLNPYLFCSGLCEFDQEFQLGSHLQRTWMHLQISFADARFFYTLCLCSLIHNLCLPNKRGHCVRGSNGWSTPRHSWK